MKIFIINVILGLILNQASLLPLNKDQEPISNIEEQEFDENFPDNDQEPTVFQPDFGPISREYLKPLNLWRPIVSISNVNKSDVLTVGENYDYSESVEDDDEFLIKHFVYNPLENNFDEISDINAFVSGINPLNTYTNESLNEFDY